MSSKQLVAEKGKLQCWWLPHALSCCYFNATSYCQALTHYIVKRTDTDFVIALCYKHLPSWAKEGIRNVAASHKATTR